MLLGFPNETTAKMAATIFLVFCVTMNIRKMVSEVSMFTHFTSLMLSQQVQAFRKFIIDGPFFSNGLANLKRKVRDYSNPNNIENKRNTNSKESSECGA